MNARVSSQYGDSGQEEGFVTISAKIERARDSRAEEPVAAEHEAGRQGRYAIAV
jgi:hypothetical protein